MKSTFLSLALVSLLACDSAETDLGVSAAQTLDMEVIATGLSSAIDLQMPPQPCTELFVAEQKGLIRRISSTGLQSVIDVRHLIDLEGGTPNEVGLFGFALDPAFAFNGTIYVRYQIDNSGDKWSRVSVLRPTRSLSNYCSANIGTAFEEQILVNYQNSSPAHRGDHLGGSIAFDPNGYLYVPTGDGGCCGDPGENAQDVGSKLGKILRVTQTGYVQVWARGLRNPFRSSIDPRTGWLFVADVGDSQTADEDAYEEVSVVDTSLRAANPRPNFGWPIYEGRVKERPAADPSNLVTPFISYGHDEGCAVVGGVVYRNGPSDAGRYYYGDFCYGWVRSRDLETGADELRFQMATPSAFATDHTGGLYVASLGGDVYRVVGSK